MKTLVLAVASTVVSWSALQAQEIRTITQTSGPLTVSENAIVQIVGVAADPIPGSGGYSLPEMQKTFADGTKVRTTLFQGLVSSTNTVVTNNNLVGSVFTGITKMEVLNGNASGNPLKAAVTVKIMSQASEVLSTPMVLPPVDDALYVITLETSVDMTNWVPSYPGEFLGNGSHRFFRVKAVRKPTATQAPNQSATQSPAK